jgi:hypothetical protein
MTVSGINPYALPLILFQISKYCELAKDNSPIMSNSWLAQVRVVLKNTQNL